ncbi:hypothetical protein CSIM01_02335 [Colletotrichum simmondsii]|uniref:NACHT-NTPase and P-loop NTPases N-terminal domain-containing protein n=1 Tax=Colletotrichum simmondsii TaxID=703756 RepID=A0A135SDL8_9PEZI|nr:hypothetical protein CSIM01_02335 [Colletotrichum simmondsii]
MSFRFTASRILRDVRDTDEDIRLTQDRYEKNKKVPDLPRVFHDVSKAFNAVSSALQAIQLYLSKGEPKAEEDVDQDELQNEKDAAIKSRNSASHLAEVFEAVFKADDGNRAIEYRMRAGKDRQVEVLMMDIIEATLVLAKPPAASEKQIADLQELHRAISQIQPSQADTNGGGIQNTGSGTQNIHTGRGHQNVNTGKGQQFIGTFATPPYRSS